MRYIDEKHYIGDDYRIYKSGNNQVIPDDEPTILFRGRDKLALPLLLAYRDMCINNGCTDYQLATLDRMIARFAYFAETSKTMKQPGCTHGK